MVLLCTLPLYAFYWHFEDNFTSLLLIFKMRFYLNKCTNILGSNMKFLLKFTEVIKSYYLITLALLLTSRILIELG